MLPDPELVWYGLRLELGPEAARVMGLFPQLEQDQPEICPEYRKRREAGAKELRRLRQAPADRPRREGPGHVLTFDTWLLSLAILSKVV